MAFGMARIARGMAARAAVVSAPCSRVLRFTFQVGCGSFMSVLRISFRIGSIAVKTILFGSPAGTLFVSELRNAAKKAANRRDNAFLFVVAQMRKDGQRQDFTRCALALWKVTFPIAQRG
jgi:hypothetical protein